MVCFLSKIKGPSLPETVLARLRDRIGPIVDLLCSQDLHHEVAMDATLVSVLDEYKEYRPVKRLGHRITAFHPVSPSSWGVHVSRTHRLQTAYLQCANEAQHLAVNEPPFGSL